MAEYAPRWRPMITAPKDGTRIVVAIRASVQGSADIDIVRWGQSRRAGDACWTSTDSSRDCAIVYDDWEVASWLPLPSTMPGVRTPGMASKFPVWPAVGGDLDEHGV